MTRRERMEHRLEQRREWAEKREAKSAAAYAASKRIADQIPFGQPILVGHHSERGHRRDIARIDSAMRQSCESAAMAKHHEQKADGIERQLDHTIFSDDDNAVEALQAKIEAAEKSQEAMKAANKIIRRKPKNESTPEKIAELAALGISEARAAKLFAPDFCGRIGFAGFETSNNNANIRRMKERIKQIETMNARKEAAEAAPGGVTIVASGSALGTEYVRVTFAEKPERSVIDALKVAGFYWSSGSWHGPTAKLPEGIAE